MSAVLPAPPLIADAERMVGAFLRAEPAVARIVGERVYTAFPTDAGGEPLVVLTRFGGTPPFSQPLVLDEAALQIDCYGGPKVLAHELFVTVRSTLCTLEGQARPEGVCSGIRFGAGRYMPDETFKPARPRYIADVTVYVRAIPPATTQEEVPSHA